MESLTWAVLYRRRSRFKKEHGCQDPAKYPNTDPIFGIDVWWDTYQSIETNRLLPKIASRSQKLVQIPCPSWWRGKHRINSIEPESYKAMLSTHFSSLKFPSRRTYVLKQFMGNAIFSSHGPTWQHSRAIIRPYLTKDSFVDEEMLDHELLRECIFISGVRFVFRGKLKLQRLRG